MAEVKFRQLLIGTLKPHLCLHSKVIKIALHCILQSCTHMTTPFTSHNDLHFHYKCINNKVDSETETSIHTHTYIIKIE